MFGKKALATCVLGSAAVLEAAPLYTNTWSNTEGVSVVKNWNDAANWTVAYDGEMPAPASSVPTADSYVRLYSSASISLQEGDEVKVGSTDFIAASKTGKTLNLTIPSGAAFSLLGADNTSHMGTSTWVDGGTNNKITFDINGGLLTLGQRIFNMRGNTQTAYQNVPLNHIKIRNGGALAITNGYLRMFGGSSPNSDGRGCYTNIIDVQAGSSIILRGRGSIAMGGGISYDNPHTSEAYFGAGWLNVTGGEIVARDTTSPLPLYMGVHKDCDIGAYVNVTDGGRIDLGGKALYVQSQGTNVIRVASGGVISNFNFSVQQGASTQVGYQNLIDIDDGKVYVNEMQYMTADGSRGPNGRSTFRIHGSEATLDLDKWNLSGKYSAQGVPPFFCDMRLKAHTSRTADFPVRPIRTRRAVWDGGNGGGVNAYALGVWRLSPDGGVQLVHKNQFELLCRKHDDQGNYKFDSRYGGLIGEEMWQTNTTYTQEKRWKDYTTYEYAYQFRVMLKDEAKLADGEQLATGVPRAWYQLPKFTARELNTNKYERISVRLQLEPQGDATLAGLVADMNAAGQTALEDDSVTPYNVRVDLPADELAANVTTDNIVMDFVKVDSYCEAVGAAPHVTNALIRAVSCEKVKKQTGNLIILR